MKRLFLISILLLSLTSVYAITNNSVLQGRVIDAQTSQPLPFVNLILLLNNKESSGAQTDFDGFFKITNLDSGTYEIKATFMGYQPTMLTGIKVLTNNTKSITVKMKASAIEMESFVITEYKTKLIDKGNTSVRTTVSYEDFSNMSVRSAPKVNYQTSGVTYSYDNGNSYNVRGSRATENYYYIDGMKVAGDQSSSQVNNPYPNEEYNELEDNGYKDVTKNPLSTFSVDVDHASYTNVRRFINQGYLPPIDAIRIEEMVNYFHYDYPQPKGDDPFSISTEYTDCPWNSNHKLVHIGIQGKEIDLENAPSNNLVFLIDVSGSMNSQNKLGLVKTGLYLLVDQLREEDNVAIVVYAGAAGLVLPATSGADKKKIKSVIEQLGAGGSTAGGAGINLAYQVAKDNFLEKGNNRIILATDGDFNVGVSNQKELISLIESKRNDDIFITVLGFGNGNLHDATMEQLANKGNGNYNYIDNALEARKVFVSELGANLITIAKDVKVQVEFNPAHVKGYRLIGYVNRKLQDEDFNDDTKDAGEIGSGHSVTMLYEIIPAGSEELVFDIDELKYQKDPLPNSINELQKEVLTIKFRYKKPTGTTSILITDVLFDNKVLFDNTSENCRFSASVASFGMLLRESQFKGDFNYKNVIKLAKNSKGIDDDGIRSEFIRLVEMVASL